MQAEQIDEEDEEKDESAQRNEPRTDDRQRMPRHAVAGRYFSDAR
jgi:hypothetical protein